MATNILMPALSPTMTEGTLARWLKKEGDQIKAGDVIAEIETDKATMEVEAVDEGVLGKILVSDGTAGVKVNDTIGVLVEPGEQVGAAEQKPAPKQDAGEVAAKVENTPTQAAPTPAPVANGKAESERVFASPLARRMAEQAGVKLADVKGTGPNGRIVRADIESAHNPETKSAPAPAAAKPAAPAQASPAAAVPVKRAPPVEINAPGTKTPLNMIKRVTARRLTESKQTVPHFYVSIDVELDALLKLRAELNGRSPKEGADVFKLSVNDMLIKACAATLRQVPRVNASFTDDGIFSYDDVDISVAVSIPDGLITPIIRKADQKGLAAISNEAKGLFEKAKTGKLKPEEFQGGSFSISNMGMYGVRDFAAIINPPQAAILAVAAGEPRPVVRNGALAIATVMTVTLSVDHRVIDGALAAEWISKFKKIVEDPLSLML
jgi:pyruvate dehydrogenase E2 component (dihydrolipoamide acetyltransferase)